MKYPATFCPLPWTHQATYTDGSVLLCCVAGNDSGQNLRHQGFKESFHSRYWQEVRRQMKSGEWPKSCERCRVEELSGCRSHRLEETSIWESRIGVEGIQRLLNATRDDGHVDFLPTSIDLRVENKCNLQCVMCRPHESLKWLGLAQAIGSEAKQEVLRGDMRNKTSIELGNYGWQGSGAVWEEMRELAPSLEEIIIGGGEPMLLNGHMEFIRYCVEKGYARNIQLRYHTNLTFLPREYFDLWKEFKVVEFFASIDGLRERNHYVRFPSQWAEIEKNLDFLDSLPYANLKTRILYSCHALSLFHLDEMAHWIEDRDFQKVTYGFNGYFSLNIVMYPTYLSPQVYPREVKEDVTRRLQEFERRSRRPSRKMAGVVKFMNDMDKSELLPVLGEYIRLLDKNRGTDFAAVFPELSRALAEWV
jgi:MoaA/NifB/PqqE/SkfB family radical SAM enzyme